MGQASDEAIQQHSTVIEQGLHPSRQPTEALVTGAVHLDPEAQYDVVVNMDLLNSDPQAQDGLSVSGSVDLEVSFPGGTNHPRPEHSTGRFGSIIDLTLGANRSDTIWRLRLLATFIFVALGMVGIFSLPRYLHGVHATYQRVILITSVGAPVAVAAITLFVSFWLPSERNNWITGLSVANFSLFCGALAMYLVLQRGTGN